MKKHKRFLPRKLDEPRTNQTNASRTQNILCIFNFNFFCSVIPSTHLSPKYSSMLMFVMVNGDGGDDDDGEMFSINLIFEIFLFFIFVYCLIFHSFT